MTTLISDVLTQLAFALFENKGVFAVLLGSGLSRAAEIPTGWEITLDLIRRVALAQGTVEQPDWAKGTMKQRGKSRTIQLSWRNLQDRPMSDEQSCTDISSRPKRTARKAGKFRLPPIAQSLN